MTTRTIIMIVCAVLYGLIVILFREENTVIRDDDVSTIDDSAVNTDVFPGVPGLFCSDGTPGADGLLASDFDKVSSE